MAFVIKTAKGIRNHWKKSTFAALVLAYGCNKLKEKYEIQLLMEAYCKEAMRYGQQTISNTLNPRTITVILNPVANRRKAVDQYEKYCAPILNLAGICVDVVQTENEGHAKDLVTKVNGTDAIIVAGGDGTLSEVITGLLRRTGENNTNIIPVGVLPLGKSNSVGFALFPGGDKLSEVKSMADASLAIIQEATKPMDVMKIELIDEESEEKKPPVYALSGIEWGAYRDAASKKEKYWYYGPLKKYATYVFNGYKDSLSWNCNAMIHYSPPCDGCTNCSIVRDDEINNKWYHKFLTQKSKPKPIVNDDCKKTEIKEISTTDLELFTSNTFTHTEGPPKLHLTLGPATVDYIDFVKDGWNSEQGSHRQIKETIKARQIEIHPTNVQQSEENQVWFSIDKEDFEVKPIRITLLPKLVKMFCKQSDL